MKVLLIHTFFHICGGIETSFFNIADILRSNGHEVVYFAMHHPNNYATKSDKYFVSYFPSAAEMTRTQKIKFLFRLFYSRETRKKIRALIKEEQPDIAHIHSCDHQFSYSLILELKRCGIPIVFTLHGYGFVCPEGELFDNGKICHACKGNKFYRMLFKQCIYSSKIKTIIKMLNAYFYIKILKIYKCVDLFIAPSKFLFDNIKKMGFNEKVVYIANPFLFGNEDPRYDIFSKSIIYYGRLSKEKGVTVLLDAIRDFETSLKIAGEGPERIALEKIVNKRGLRNVSFLGFLDQDKLKEEISQSMFTVCPSVCFESFGYSILESFALGKPVIASDLGAFRELVKDSVNGLLFEAGNVKQLQEKIALLLNRPEFCIQLGKNARKFVEHNFGRETFYASLIEQYRLLIKQRE